MSRSSLRITPEVRDALPKCRTYNNDGTGPICDQPARYIVWGTLFGKMNVGPKCWRHLPKYVKNHTPSVAASAIFDLAEFGMAIMKAKDPHSRASVSEFGPSEEAQFNEWACGMTPASMDAAD